MLTHINENPTAAQIENQNNHTTQLQTSDSTLKIPPLFITNKSQFL